jgi:DNA-binding transcriptional regulator PaaX
VGVLLVRGSIEPQAPEHLATRLWDLGGIAEVGRRLSELAEQATTWLSTGDAAALPDAFMVSVAIVRFLRREPQLPAALVGGSWPPDELRRRYVILEQAHVELMLSFLDEADR